jgi:hypothetical protein
VFWGSQLHHPDVQFVVPKAPLKVTAVKKLSVNLGFVNDAPVRSGDPGAGSRSGDVRLIKEAPITSETVILSTLLREADWKYAVCCATVYGVETVPVLST